uniref:SFRICE_033360 n=1 Tax=Spodoptera frugiperda TaxID=7108 RepID=A0A2H1VBH7_SPOFR
MHARHALVVAAAWLVARAAPAASESARVRGAVRFGALFAVHGAPTEARAGAACGVVREHYGIQRVEATLMALDAINADPRLLPWLRLGADLRDSCWAAPTALRQTIDLVRDAIAPSQALRRRSLSSGKAGLCSTVCTVPCIYIFTKFIHIVLRCFSLSDSFQVDLIMATNRLDCPGTSELGRAPATPLVAVLGPGASSAAVQVQNLLQLFSIPQVGPAPPPHHYLPAACRAQAAPIVSSRVWQVSYSATARELSDRARFSTFFRVVPSDKHQARLLVALLRAHNWTYVHALHTDESYGQSGMAAFREEAARGGVCVAREVALRAAPSAAAVDAALARLARGPRVAVCWCEGRTARALLAGLARAPRRLRLVASDGWADRRDVVDGLEHAALHALTLRIRSPYLNHFDRHYLALTPLNNSRNPWFQEFWEQKFNLSQPRAGLAVIAAVSPLCDEWLERRHGVLTYHLTQVLTGNDSFGGFLFLIGRKLTIPSGAAGRESLAANYTQEPKLALVVRGVYALAHALHDMRREACGRGGRGLCAAMLPFNVSRYRLHLAQVRFRAPDGGLVAFDDNGDPPPESVPNSHSRLHVGEFPK